MARGTNQSPKHKGMSYTKFGYIFIAPFIIVYCLFSLYPLLNTFWYSVTNMKSTTADFWGFDDKDVYYDRYLDLYQACGSNDDTFTEMTGVAKLDYMNTIRAFFKLQDTADYNEPLDKKSVKAILEAIPNNDYGVEGDMNTALADLQKCLDENSLEYLTTDDLAVLKAWKAAFTSANKETSDLQKTFASIFSTTDAILNPEVVESEDGEEVEAITLDAIAESDAFVEFVDSFESMELDENQKILVNFLDAYLADSDASAKTVAEYLAAAKDTPAIMAEPAFYYVMYHMNETKNAKYVAVDEDGEESLENIEAIAVPFIGDLQTYLTENEWATVINGIDGLGSIEAYGNGEVAIPTNDSDLVDAVQALNDTAIIDKILYVVDGDTLVPAEDKATNAIFALNNYEPKDIPANEFVASTQIGRISTYFEDTNRGLLKTAGVEADKYITFNGSFNIKKYNKFKAETKMSDGRTLKEVFTLSYYEKLDDSMKDKCVADAKIELKAAKEARKALQAEYDALYASTSDALKANKKALDEAQAAYDKLHKDGASEEALAAGKETLDAARKAYEEVNKPLASLKNDIAKETGNIRKANEKIGYPVGIFNSKAMDAKKEYIICGLENFNKIFSSKQTRDTVLGAFVSTFIMWVIGFVPQIVLALILSAWFTDTKLKLKGLGVMKALMYLPNVITAVTVAIFFRKIFMYSTNEAALPPSQIILRALGDKDGFNFFQKPWPTRLIVCFINFWMWYGNTMIVLIAGITSINESLYESAQIDGANSFQTYTKITMPLLRPILLYTMVTSMIGGLQMFDIPQNLNMNSAPIKFNGSSIRSTRTVLMYVNDMAFGQAADKMVGLASAASVILFFVTIVLSVVIFYLMRDKDAAKAAKAKKLARKAGAAK